ncbi:hypothetical protein [Tenacibaculum aquimarinum]|uniref:hypothetical protein n=1 Tax=Tenacibaculum aquimarinum TaxID=2910675 RepID=UPI001F0B3F25|nr:hypothetical protein [Tenacibaculum aquimarinum]MCH3882371.1 hypothetical protein [Tenacibaculum aquimarinum]
MQYEKLTKEELLIEIDNKSKAIINMGKQLAMINPKGEVFDIFLIASLNRTVNISKAYTSLIRDNNFLAAAPLIRINIDTLLRLYASIISEYDRNTFATKVIAGELIKKMKLNVSNEKLSDFTLYTEISKVENMEWVSKIYKVGNSYVHLEKSHIFSASKIVDNKESLINMSIGFHDSFIPENEKFGSAYWMNKTIDSIIHQAQIWMYEKAKKTGFDIEKLNNF